MVTVPVLNGPLVEPDIPAVDETVIPNVEEPKVLGVGPVVLKLVDGGVDVVAPDVIKPVEDVAPVVGPVVVKPVISLTNFDPVVVDVPPAVTDVGGLEVDAPDGEGPGWDGIAVVPKVGSVVDIPVVSLVEPEVGSLL